MRVTARLRRRGEEWADTRNGKAPAQGRPFRASVEELCASRPACAISGAVRAAESARRDER